MSKFAAFSLAAAVLCLGACATPPPVVERPVVTEAGERQARMHHSQGASYLREGRLALAIRELRAAAGLNPNDKWIRLALGEAYRLRAMMTEAEHEVVESLEIDPQFQEGRLTLSGIYIQVGRFADAIAQSQRLIDDPTYTDVWMALTNKGYALLQLGQLSEARKSLVLAAEFNEKYWRAYLNLGILAAQEGQRDEAIALFAKVVQHGAGTLGEAEANYRAAEVYVSLGDQGSAIRHLLAASERNPDGQWGKASVEYLRRLQ